MSYTINKEYENSKKVRLKMTKDVIAENKELKRTLCLIDKALIEHRLRELDLPEIDTSYLQVEVPVKETKKCNCGERESALEAEIAELKKKLAEKEDHITELKSLLQTADTAKEEDKEIEWKEPRAEVEEVAVKAEKPKRQYKERGGSVFSDFKSLSLENNNFEGNSVIYRNED